MDSQTDKGEAEVYELPMTPEILNARLTKLVTLTHILTRDGETLWDKVVLLQTTVAGAVAISAKNREILEGVQGQQVQLLKSFATLTDHVLKIRSPLSRAQAMVLTFAGAATGGGIAALAFHLVVHFLR